MSKRALFGCTLAVAGVAIIYTNIYLPTFSAEAAEARARAAGTRGRAAATAAARSGSANGVWANVGLQRDYLRASASASASTSTSPGTRSERSA